MMFCSIAAGSASSWHKHLQPPTAIGIELATEVDVVEAG